MHYTLQKLFLQCTDFQTLSVHEPIHLKNKIFKSSFKKYEVRIFLNSRTSLIYSSAFSPNIYLIWLIFPIGRQAHGDKNDFHPKRKGSCCYLLLSQNRLQTKSCEQNSAGLLSFCMYFQYYDSVTVITVLFISLMNSVQVWILSTWNSSNITLKFHSPAMFVNL